MCQAKGDAAAEILIQVPEPTHKEYFVIRSHERVDECCKTAKKLSSMLGGAKIHVYVAGADQMSKYGAALDVLIKKGVDVQLCAGALGAGEQASQTNVNLCR